jgi:hypothetical protein
VARPDGNNVARSWVSTAVENQAIWRRDSRPVRPSFSV